MCLPLSLYASAFALHSFCASMLQVMSVASAAAQGTVQPNIVYIMADDLNADWKNDRLGYMPNLKTYFREQGTEFENHVAAQPVCGPSRSSMLLGRYPHNTGYQANNDLRSYTNFLNQHNNSVGKWLKDAGYYTAFFGKYVNGCDGHVPSGWSYWGALKNVYDFYNATVWEKDWEDPNFGPPQQRVMTHIHQADFLGNFTVDHAAKAVAAKRPFFISVTPVMPHWGTCYGPGPASVYPKYDPHWEFNLDLANISCGSTCAMPISPCPTNRNRHKFDGQKNPRIEGVWNVSIKGKRPEFMRKSFEGKEGHLTEFQAWREDIGWQNRSASLIDLDEMIGGIVKGIKQLGVLEDTVIFFTSDNGYHLGEHKMPFGKGQPYDTDVRLPMYVRGPGVLAGRVLPHPTTHLDITATIVDLAGAQSSAPTNLDGLPFTAELSNAGQPPALGDAWRQHSFSEFFADTNTWRLVRVVNSTHKFSYMWWCTNDTEVFNMASDHWQTENVDGKPGDAFAVRAALDGGRLVNALGNCKGRGCSHPAAAAGLPANGSLPCFESVTAATEYMGTFKFVPDPKTKLPNIHGWAVDTTSALPGKKNGSEPVLVHLRVNGKFGLIPPLLANLTRDDLPKANPAIPDPNHGFNYAPEDLPQSLFKGKQTIVLFGQVGNGPLHPLGSSAPNARQKTPGMKRCLCDGKDCPCK